MISAAKPSATLRSVLTQPTGGVVGLVDDLLAVCLEYCLDFELQADRCRFRMPAGDWEEVADIALANSVLRAILARVAFLCNEGTPGPVSPYGGQGEISVPSRSHGLVHATLVNTASAQRLELKVSRTPAGESPTK